MLDSPSPHSQETLDQARRLVLALDARTEEQYRLAVLKRVARELGSDAFPQFLKLLLVIAESDDTRAKRLLADTLAGALRRMDLPSGQLTSWGATRLAEGDPTDSVSANELSRYFFGGAPKRQLGPIEYLTVWLFQRTQRVTLDAALYADALAKIISLINTNPEASERYARKLAADSNSELEGTYTRDTRARLSAIASYWLAGASPQEIAVAAVDCRSI